MASGEPERVETIVIGGGQAGLSLGYYLALRGLPFVILDANERIGDVWRNRWDSLRLFTPRRFDGLTGMPFPGPSHSFPSKDEVGDYLETFAARFELPVRTGVRVHQLTKNEEGFVVTTGDRRIESRDVVVAMGTHQVPRVPPYASELGPSVAEMHSADYRNPFQLQEGGVLVVGVGNSGGEIALEETLHRLGDRHGASDGTGRSIEGRKEPIARRIHLAAPVPSQQSPDPLMVGDQELSPRPIAQLGSPLRRANDICEHHSGEHPVEIGLFMPHAPRRE